MRHWTTVGRLGVVGSALMLVVPFISADAHAARSNQHPNKSNTAVAHTEHLNSSHASQAHEGAGHASVTLVSTHLHGGFKQAVYITRKGHKGPMHTASGGDGYGISCVPYAREVSGIALKGNAVTWWDEAAGQYARGNAPEPGSVLNFRANATMRLGHVAVVTSVLSHREIEIDHANWWGPGASKGGISRNISVVDVSPNNDWTSVRVGLGHTGEYGSIYSTYGFIYARRDDGNTRLAVAHSRHYDEVAEAPSGGFDGSLVNSLTFDAPDRRIK